MPPATTTASHIRNHISEVSIAVVTSLPPRRNTSIAKRCLSGNLRLFYLNIGAMDFNVKSREKKVTE